MKLPEDALEFFREQGRKGGKLRSKRLTKKQKSESGRNAALARWAKAKEKKDNAKKS